MKNKKGFTLVELLAVIVVLAVILVIAGINVMQSINDSKKKAKYIAAKEIVEIASSYIATETEGVFPDESGNICVKTKTLIEQGYLEEDVTNPEDGSNGTIDASSNQKICKVADAVEQDDYTVNNDSYVFDKYIYYLSSGNIADSTTTKTTTTTTTTISDKSYDGAAIYSFYQPGMTEKSATCGTSNCGYTKNTSTSSYISAARSGSWIKVFYKLPDNLSNYKTLRMTVSKCSDSWEMQSTYSFAVGKQSKLNDYKKVLTYKGTASNGVSTCSSETFNIDINSLTGTDNYLAIKVDHGTDVSAYTTSLTINSVKLLK